MPLRNARPITFRPQGVSDAVDGSSAFPGALTSAADLIPAMHTKNVFVPRPAAFSYIDFGRKVTGEELLVIGDKIYGIVTSARFPGYSEPFAYNIKSASFIPISGVNEHNVPKSAPATGDWTPPTSTPLGAYILFTHPAGFALPNAFGWLDMTGMNDSATGSTGYSQEPALWGAGVWGTSEWVVLQPSGGLMVVNLSKDVNQAGWRPGLMISDSAGVIPPETRIADVSVDGLAVKLTKSATSAVANDTFTVLGGTPDAPLWAAGNTAIHPLVGVPVAVAQFNGRAWYAVGSATVFSDALDPLMQTNEQVLTYDNGIDVTAFGTIPFQTTAGGIIQSLLAFQEDTAIQQISGDQATQNLAKNLLSQIGTLAPNAIISTPIGVIFIAPDGVRIISQTGQVSDPIGANGDGVALPMINSVYPSRMAASYNEDAYRVSITYNKTESGSPTSAIMSAEFWFHLKSKMWSGPHSFPAALIAPLDQGATRHGHVLFPLGPSFTGIWFSNTRPLIDARYTENGAPMNWVYETTLLPDTESMFMNAVNETTVMLSLAPTGMASVVFKDDDGVLLDQVMLSGFPARPGVWGAAVWGEARWGGPPASPAYWGSAIWGTSVWGDGIGAAIITQRLVAWDHELVFKQGQLVVSGQSAPQVAIGNVRLRYQQTGYTITDVQSGVSS
jgi:hypothetical protein